ncbi:hypothetical protein BaRGS_00020051, partial [Batillaria attramentaria]
RSYGNTASSPIEISSGEKSDSLPDLCWPVEDDKERRLLEFTDGKVKERRDMTKTTSSGKKRRFKNPTRSHQGKRAERLGLEKTRSKERCGRARGNTASSPIKISSGEEPDSLPDLSWSLKDDSTDSILEPKERHFLDAIAGKLKGRRDRSAAGNAGRIWTYRT